MSLSFLHTMKSHFFLFTALLFLSLTICPVIGQNIDQSTEINQFLALRDQKKYNESAKLAMQIAQAYQDTLDYEFAKKYYEYGVNDSERTDDINLKSEAYFAFAFSTYLFSESLIDAKKKEGLYKEALRNFRKATDYFSKSSLDRSMNHTLSYFYGGLCFYRLGNNKNAKAPLKEALEYAQGEKYNYVAQESARLLWTIYGADDEPKQADYYHNIYQNYIEFTSAIDSLEKTKQTNQELSDAIGNKEEELLEKNLALQIAEDEVKEGAEVIREREDQLSYAIIITVIILVLLIFIFRAYRFTKRAKRELEAKNKEILNQKRLIEKRQDEIRKEKAKSERLLLNILPKQTALELRENGRTRPRYYKKVTVIFTDFKGFTNFSENRAPDEIIRELDVCFNAFDNIIEKHNIEKIKTMGDGYMCAGGVPMPNDTNPIDAVKASIEMLDFMTKRKEEMQAQGKDFFEVRIGIHTGPVIAGVVGKKKFAYDIWGDTVNVASRMESSGEEGRVNISGDTFVHVKDKFFFTHRGKIKAKNKGEIDMFFVDGRVKYAKEI